MNSSSQLSTKNLFTEFDWNLMGFGLCRAWITLLFSLSVPALLATTISIRLLLLLPGAAFCLLLLPAPKLLLSRQIRTFALILSGVLSLLGLLGVYVGAAYNLVIIAAFAMALLSISAALMQVLWGEKVSLLPERKIDFYTVSAFLLAAGLGVLMQAITDETVRWIFQIVLPVASWTLLYRGFNQGEWGHVALTESIDSSNIQTVTASATPIPFGRFCISILVFVLIFNAISPVFSTAENPFPVRTTANLVVTLGLFLLVLKHGSVNLTNLYTLSFIILLGSVLAMLFVPQSFLFIPTFFAAAGYKLFDILFWCLLITMAHRLLNKNWHILGLGMAANFGGMGLGSALGDLTSFLQSTVTLGDTFIICTFVFILAITIVVILPEQMLAQLIPRRQTKPTEKDSHALEILNTSADPYQQTSILALEERCKQTAAKRQLTRRESEVLLLLAQGRTQSVIAKKLGISEGTVHTHILHVYQKLDVHSQQELIELLN